MNSVGLHFMVLGCVGLHCVELVWVVLRCIELGWVALGFLVQYKWCGLAGVGRVGVWLWLSLLVQEEEELSSCFEERSMDKIEPGLSAKNCW